MKTAALALIVALAGFSAPVTADACAMRKMPIKLMVADGQLEKGKKAEERGAMRAAIRHYERAMNGKGNPTVRAEAAVLAAKVHIKLGKDDKAVSRLRRAVSLDGDFLAGRVMLGQALMASTPGEALTHLQAAQGLDRLNADIYADLAVVHAKLGQKEVAQRNLITAKGLGADPAKVTAAEKALAGTGVAVL